MTCFISQTMSTGLGFYPSLCFTHFVLVSISFSKDLRTLAICMTVVPIRILIRARVVPIRILIGTTVVPTRILIRTTGITIHVGITDYFEKCDNSY